MSAVVLSHLGKTFRGGIRAVDDLSLEISEGELLVLMGPSGCGKTTTLRLIAGLERPTSGQITIDGRDVAGLPPRKRNVAMVFQQGALYPHMSVRRNMAFGLKLRGAPRSEIAPRVEEAAAALAIADLLDRQPSELSYGQQQRVALGRAMAGRPKLFLLDEPLSSLDAPLRRQLRQEIRRLHSRLGVPMIYVTHDPAEAMALGQRIAVLRDGRLQQAADPQTLYDWPANRFAASICGNPGMNFFAGRLEVAEGSFALALSGKVKLKLPEICRETISPFAGRGIILGVRPEHLQLGTQYSVQSTQYAPQIPQPSPEHSALSTEYLVPSTEHDHSIAIPAKVDAVERLGTETHVHLSAGNQSFIVRTNDVQPQPGEQVVATAAAEHLRFFDAATEAAIIPSQSRQSPGISMKS